MIVIQPLGLATLHRSNFNYGNDFSNTSTKIGSPDGIGNKLKGTTSKFNLLIKKYHINVDEPSFSIKI